MCLYICINTIVYAYIRKYAYALIFLRIAHAHMCVYKCIGIYIDFIMHLRKLVLDFHIISYLISFE